MIFIVWMWCDLVYPFWHRRVSFFCSFTSYLNDLIHIYILESDIFLGMFTHLAWLSEFSFGLNFDYHANFSFLYFFVMEKWCYGIKRFNVHHHVVHLTWAIWYFKRVFDSIHFFFFFRWKEAVWLSEIKWIEFLYAYNILYPVNRDLNLIKLYYYVWFFLCTFHSTCSEKKNALSDTLTLHFNGLLTIFA